MTRPQTVQDVFEVLSRHRLVEPARLNAFMDRHQLPDVITSLERLVSDGLLTVFQANEVANGRGAQLWLGSYRVLDRLGRGGMGSVFLAEHSVLGRRVAVKALSDSLRADPHARKRFVREARAASALDHPNIVRVFDVNMTHEPPYLVMEYVDGVSLQAAVSQTGTFSAGETAAVGTQIADGLVQAAAVGLVHRDIKPANVLIDRRGAVKILDLGIVRFTHDDTHSRTNGAEFILGTIDYLAPEQAEDSSKVDIRADIYALGATLYFLLAGHPPYPVTDVRRKLSAKRTEDPPPIHQLRPDVPIEFSALIAQLMTRDLASRIPAPAIVVAALHTWAAPGSDFPGRFFRMTSDTTAHGRRLTDHEPARDPLPDTILIIKAAARRGGADSVEGTPSSLDSVSSPCLSANTADRMDETPSTGPTSLLINPQMKDISTPMSDTQGGGEAALTDEMRSLPQNPTESPITSLIVVRPEVVPESLEVVLPKNQRRRVIVGVVVIIALACVVAGLLALLVR